MSEIDLLFSGVFDLPWWGCVVVALVLTHVTIVAVTVFLHRHQAHRALDLHPAVSHFFRLWLWLTTGMVTKEWAAIHRKHHAKVETPEDPHSPQVLGINRVLWGGVFLYVKESHNRDTIERYGHSTPDDWLERHVYSRYVVLGLTLMGTANVLLFGIVPGVLVFLTQIVWIPFWAAGVINGILEALGLAKVKHVAPVPRFTARRLIPNLQTLQAVITQKMLPEPERMKLVEMLSKSRALQTVYFMRRELIALWERSTASREQLVRRLQDWCQRAEASGIRPLVEFSRRLRCYA